MASPSTGGYDAGHDAGYDGGFGTARQAPPPGRAGRRRFLGAATAGAFGPAVLGPARAQEAQAGAVGEEETAPAAPPRPVPGWSDEVKLGIFIHWNAAAIPAFAPVHLLSDLHAGDGAGLPKWQQEQIWRTLPYAEMYQNTVAVPGSETSRFHAERYGNRPYDDFVEPSRASSVRRWDPQPWADLFERASAGYVVLTAKTEDGFLLWPSAHPNPRKKRWQSTRDVIGELAAAVRERGMRRPVEQPGSRSPRSLPAEGVRGPPARSGTRSRPGARAGRPGRPPVTPVAQGGTHRPLAEPGRQVARRLCVPGGLAVAAEAETVQEVVADDRMAPLSQLLESGPEPGPHRQAVLPGRRHGQVEDVVASAVGQAVPVQRGRRQPGAGHRVDLCVDLCAELGLGLLDTGPDEPVVVVIARTTQEPVKVSLPEPYQLKETPAP